MSKELAEHAIAKAVVMIAQSLGLSVIAEGVETQEQMTALEEHGCDAGQGFLLSAALPEDEALKFALQHNEQNTK
jgi:EAL domain-containing protein (putative c-di-GMP-specific phosphodiesterase class I)